MNSMSDDCKHSNSEVRSNVEDVRTKYSSCGTKRINRVDYRSRKAISTVRRNRNKTLNLDSS